MAADHSSSLPLFPNVIGKKWQLPCVKRATNTGGNRPLAGSKWNHWSTRQNFHNVIRVRSPTDDPQMSPLGWTAPVLTLGPFCFGRSRKPLKRTAPLAWNDAKRRCFSRAEPVNPQPINRYGPDAKRFRNRQRPLLVLMKRRLIQIKGLDRGRTPTAASLLVFGPVTLSAYTFKHADRLAGVRIEQTSDKVRYLAAAVAVSDRSRSRCGRRRCRS